MNNLQLNPILFNGQIFHRQNLNVRGGTSKIY